MTAYNEVPSNDRIENTVAALTANGFKVTVVQTGADAKKAALDLIPKGAEVMTATSQTLATIGVTPVLNESGDYDAVMPKLLAMWGDPSKKREQRKLGTAPDYIIGSVHALTQDGKVLIASATGSQLPAYAYGAEHVIWVVGAQKIVKDMTEARHRLETHTFPLEDKRAAEAYGHGSVISRVLLYEKEPTGRVEIIIVKEALGF